MLLKQVLVILLPHPGRSRPLPWPYGGPADAATRNTNADLNASVDHDAKCETSLPRDKDHGFVA